MRDHVLGEVIVATELGGGLPLTQVFGILVEASRDPEDWDEAVHFAVVSHEDGSVWHNRDEMIEAAGRQVPDSGGNGRAYVFIPEHLGEVLAYPGVDAGASGYRVSLGGGATLAVVLWQHAMHETADGLAPGLGAFTAQVDEDEEPATSAGVLSRAASFRVSALFIPDTGPRGPERLIAILPARHPGIPARHPGIPARRCSCPDSAHSALRGHRWRSA
jgi:hypothetical protein